MDRARVLAEIPPDMRAWLAASDRRTLEQDGLDVAAKDFVAGMTDRYAVNLFEQLFIPKPWIEIGGDNR